MERVVFRNQVLNWTMGEFAHIKVRVPEDESVAINWGDDQTSTNIGQKAALDFRHRYSKSYKESEEVVDISIEAEHILSVCDCSMDMDRISFDGSQAPSLEEVDALCVKRINVDDCCSLHTLNLQSYQGKELKLPELPSLRTLKLFGAEKLQQLDISQCTELDVIDIAYTSTIKKISVANKSRIKKVIASNGSLKNLYPKCLSILESTLERNGGSIVDFYDFLNNIES